MSTSGDVTSRLQSDPAPRASRKRSLGDLLLPPDFYPERQVDTGTWAEAVFEPAALIGATTCFVIGIVSFGQAIVPSWQTRFLVALSVLVGVEAFLYSRRLTRSVFLFKEWLVLLVPPIVLLRFLPYIDDPTASLSRDIADWWSDPGTFFSTAFVFDAIILLAIWSIVFSCTQCLNQLRVQEGEIVERTDGRFQDLYEDNWRSYDHSEPLRKLGQFYTWGGVILVLLSALASIGTAQFLSFDALGQLFAFQRPSLHLVLANVLLYFILGLLLIGEAHFVRQRTIWLLDRLTIPGELATRWVASVLGLVVLASIIAVVLPTSYSVTLGQIASYLLSLVLDVLTYTAAALFYLMYLLAHLLPRTGGAAEQAAPALPPRLPQVTPTPTGSSSLDTLRSLVFWLIALGIVGYSLRVMWGKRQPRFLRLPLLLALGLARLPFRLILGLLRLVGRMGKEVGRAVASAVPRMFRQAPAVAPRAFSFVSLSKLGPRELVEYFYLSVCERAGQLGHPRRPGVTPLEYRSVLRESLPIVDPELDRLTDAFVEARYGPRPPTRTEVQSIREQWQVLKVKLRRARLGRGTRNAGP